MNEDKLVVFFKAEQSLAVREVAIRHKKLVREDRFPEYKEKGEKMSFTFFLDRPDTGEGDESFAYERDTSLFQADMAEVSILALLHVAEFPLPEVA
ncbi:MAG: hypothetical protein HYS78_00740 [Parcubacteria group bacterium]|nr:hypothetical protein [Parcubacteria group bacterium]